MSKKREKPVQFFLPIGGNLVNQCCFVSEDDLMEKEAADNTAVLLEKAVEGKLSARSLTRHRDALLREAIRTDRAEALACLVPQRRMELARFLELFRFAEECGSPDATAWLLAYRGAHYKPAEFDAFEQRQLDLEFGLAEPEEADLRKLFRLRYVRGGVCICGVREARRSYEIPRAIGGKPVIGVDGAAFHALDPMPRIQRTFSAEGQPELGAPEGDQILLGRSMAKKGAAETPLPWQVLRREEGRALILCERPVAVLPYHRELQEVTWENCDLRRWLNSVFLPLSFTEEEQAILLSSALENPGNPNFGTDGGNPTEDRLFLLSAEEASALLPDDAARRLNVWWWLRTPGFDNSFAAVITPEGAVVRIGSFVDTEDYAVRPAMWIKTE